MIVPGFESSESNGWRVGMGRSIDSGTDRLRRWRARRSASHRHRGVSDDSDGAANRVVNNCSEDTANTLSACTPSWIACVGEGDVKRRVKSRGER